MFDNPTSSLPPITIDDVKKVQSIGRKNINDFTNEDIKTTEPFAKRYWYELGVKSPFFRAWFGDWRAFDKTAVNITNISDISGFNAVKDAIRGSIFYNADTDWKNITVGRQGIDDTISHSGKAKASEKSLSEIGTLIENAVLLDTEASDPTKNKKSKYTAFMHKLYAPITYNGIPYVAKITIEEYYENGGTKKKFYNLQNIEMSPTGVGFNSEEDTAQIAKIGDNVTISDLFALVKRYDKNFNPKSVNPLLLNKDGTPKVMYHGTDKTFSVFNKGDIGYHFGTKTQAEYRIKDNKEAHIMQAYLNIRNPLRAAFDYGDWHGKNVAGMLIETEVFDGDSKQKEIEAR